jgi:hypothetical protein
MHSPFLTRDLAPSSVTQAKIIQIIRAPFLSCDLTHPNQKKKKTEQKKKKKKPQKIPTPGKWYPQETL